MQGKIVLKYNFQCGRMDKTITSIDESVGDFDIPEFKKIVSRGEN